MEMQMEPVLLTSGKLQPDDRPDCNLELTISEEAPEATPAPEPQAPFLQTGDYAAVTTETRVYLSIDETMTEDDNGDDWQGVFTRDAVVSVSGTPPPSAHGIISA